MLTRICWYARVKVFIHTWLFCLPCALSWVQTLTFHLLLIVLSSDAVGKIESESAPPPPGWQRFPVIAVLCGPAAGTWWRHRPHPMFGPNKRRVRFSVHCGRGPYLVTRRKWYLLDVEKERLGLVTLKINLDGHSWLMARRISTVYCYPLDLLHMMQYLLTGQPICLLFFLPLNLIPAYSNMESVHTVFTYWQKKDSSLSNTITLYLGRGGKLI